MIFCEGQRADMRTSGGPSEVSEGAEVKVAVDLGRQGGWLVRGARCIQDLKSDQGGALLEFAVALPLLMTVLTGAASFTMAFYSLQAVENATAGAVQAVAAEQGTVADPCATAQTLVQAELPGWTASKISYAMTITDSSGTAHPYPSSGMTAGSSTFTCAAGSGELAPSEPVKLTVQYSYTWVPVVAFSPSSPLADAETAMAD
jgi:Flp pilus assembly protein TadG